MTREFDGRTWRIEDYLDPGPDAPLIILLAGSDELSDIFFDKLLAEKVPPLRLAVPCAVDWDTDYSPWRADIGSRTFAGGADAFGQSVESLRRTIIDEFRPRRVYVVGYSLGGLAALYLHTKMRFDGCGGCSGSFWFPGWCGYIDSQSPAGRIYLSLGGKEKNARDALMATVADATEYTRRACERSAERVFFRSEPGGHFRDPDGRLARAIGWLCAENI